MATSKDKFIQIIEEYQGVINGLCAVYYPAVPDQQDARQDIILQLWKSLPSFRGESKISTWIYKVGLNTILSKLKKGKRKPREESINLSHENMSAPLNHADDDLQLLYQVIQSLKDLDKAVVLLFLEGYKNKEIASMLELTPSNISTRMNRIRKELKSKLSFYRYEYK